MAASHSGNPGWFGHPGSTVFYPLEVLYLLRARIAHGPQPPESRALLADFDADPSAFFLLGRLLTSVFALLGICFTYRLGRRAFGDAGGLLAAWLLALSTLSVSHATIVRTDSASLLVTGMALDAFFMLLEAPSARRHVWAGASVGLAVATKYSLVVLLPVLVLAALLAGPGGDGRGHRRAVRLGVAILVAAAAFLLATPYWLPELSTVRGNLVHELRNVHLGADNLRFAGNLWWYLSDAIPSACSWPQVLFVVVGAAWPSLRHARHRVCLLTFAALLLTELACSPLHWERWIIPLLPVCAVLAACGLLLVAGLARGTGQRALLLAALVAVASVQPARGLGAFLRQQRGPSTRVQAREWVLAHVPRGSHLAQEWYTAPLDRQDFYGYAIDRYGEVPDTGLVVWQRQWLASSLTVADLSQQGIEYVVVSSAVYGRYLAEPARYPAEVAFYRTLFADAELLREFWPSPSAGGPLIRVYRLGKRERAARRN
jgi:hypothetical protein